LGIPPSPAFSEFCSCCYSVSYSRPMGQEIDCYCDRSHPKTSSRVTQAVRVKAPCLCST
jgi:hypothetical protein